MGKPEAWAALVVGPGTAAEQAAPIRDHLIVGRECAGVDDDHRLVLDDNLVSRRHLEIWLDLDHDRASVIDVSTNGTRLNGIRLERAVPTALRPGDQIRVGPVQLEFRSERFHSEDARQARTTTRDIALMPMVLVVGDIVEYSTISEYTDSAVLFENMARLFGDLRALVLRHGGVVNNFAGDAIFAVWESDPVDQGCEHAVQFALAASEHLSELAPELTIRAPDGDRIRMGWAVTVGDVAVSTLTGAHLAVLGDAANVAFRVAGLAARNGRPEVLITERARAELDARFQFGGHQSVQVKGRAGGLILYGVRRS
jgi:class 3 adenylate cyclase